MSMKIFGREPSVIIGFIGSVLTIFVALKVPWLSAGAGAAIVSFLTAAAIAATTRPVAPSAFVAAFTAFYAILAQYGFHWSDQVIAAVSGAILATFALQNRAQLTPRVDPAPIAPQAGEIR
jgi:hypothetical protein